MQPSNITDKLPNIHAETEIPFHDSCNCCQECNVSCCFPRRVKKHNKHKKTCPEYGTTNKVNDTSISVMRKDSRPIDTKIIKN